MKKEIWVTKNIEFGFESIWCAEPINNSDYIVIGKGFVEYEEFDATAAEIEANERKLENLHKGYIAAKVLIEERIQSLRALEHMS